MKKLIVFPAVDDQRARRIVATADACQPAVTVVNARDADAAQQAIVDAEAFFGKLTPALLKAARNLQWVQ